jgi:hypothetical protein
MPEPPAMKPIVSKSFFSPEGVCVNVVSESAFTLPFTALFGCKMSVLKMYLMWEGGSPGPSACNQGGHQHARRERQPGTIRGHPWPSAAIRGHPRSSAADLDTYWPNDPLTFAIREQSGCTQCALRVRVLAKRSLDVDRVALLESVEDRCQLPPLREARVHVGQVHLDDEVDEPRAGADWCVGARHVLAIGPLGPKEKVLPHGQPELMLLMRETIRGHQRSSEVIRGHQRSSEVIRGHQS